MRGFAVSLLLLLCVAATSGGKVKQALFGALFGGSRKPSASEQPNFHTDADQAELVEWLKANGYEKYASKEYIEKLDDVLAYDSIEDLTHLVADDDYSEIDMDREEAEKLQKLARYEMLKRFLAVVPLPVGAPSDLFAKHLDALIGAGYDEPDDIADLEEEEAAGFGISAEHTKILVTYAEEFETRELLHVILTTLKDAQDASPYTAESAYRPIIEALVKSGARSLADVAKLVEVPGLPAEDLAKIQADPRVQQYMNKSEL